MKTIKAPFPVNVGPLVGDIAQTFNPLGRDFALDYHVSRAHDGYVVVSVALPEGMTRAYMTLLESLTGFVRVIDLKAVITSYSIHYTKLYDDATLTTQMKSVGEVMAIGRTFKESLQKALRSLEIGSHGFESRLFETRSDYRRALSSEERNNFV